MKDVAKFLALALAYAALSAEAAVVRNLPAMTVVETETVSLDALGATAVRSSNASVFTAALRESDEAIVSGLRLGAAVLSYVDDDRGVFARQPVTVVPSYWEVLQRMFADDPEIDIAIVGDKVVLGGSTSNVDTLKRAETAKQFDPQRIVAQVAYSTAQIGALVRDFLTRAGVTNIGVNVVGKDVCLSGRMYDKQSIDQLKARVDGFVKDFPGTTVNTDELRIIKQKILINIEFVAYNDNMSRNLGFSGPESITAGVGGSFGFDYNKTTRGGHDWSSGRSTSDTDSRTRTITDDLTSNESTTGSENNRSTSDTSTKGNDWSHRWNGSANAWVDGVQATINLLKQNGAAKRLYATTLSTQSGIEAEFQNGGTIYRSTTPGMGSSGDMVTIEYGYIIRATPLIVDENTINLDFELDNKQQDGSGGNSSDIRLLRYQTKSKYLMRPGESIVLSGYKYNSESETKKGTPLLSRIPLIGSWLFGNTASDVDMNEMMLVVTVDWALDNDSDTAKEQIDELKNRKVEVDMP